VLFTKDDFVYEPGADAYRCPAGEWLTYRSTTVELGRSIKNYRTSACGRCALKPRCTRNKDGRKITRWVSEHLLEAMEDRLRRARCLPGARRWPSTHTAR
jgi:transposase